MQVQLKNITLDSHTHTQKNCIKGTKCPSWGFESITKKSLVTLNSQGMTSRMSAGFINLKTSFNEGNELPVHLNIQPQKSCSIPATSRQMEILELSWSSCIPIPVIFKILESVGRLSTRIETAAVGLILYMASQHDCVLTDQLLGQWGLRCVTELSWVESCL